MSIKLKVKKMNTNLSGTRKSTHLSTHIDPAVRFRLLSEAKPYLTADSKCAEIWSALKAANYKKSGVLDDVGIQILWDKQGANLKELLQIGTVENLKLLIDDDEDGVWNEDDQILLFTTIKEFMS